VSIFNNYVWPVALNKIGWYTYIVFCVWCGVQATITYFLLPETKNRTLEELDLIFSAPKLRQAVHRSLEKRTAAVTANGDVLAIDSKDEL